MKKTMCGVLALLAVIGVAVGASQGPAVDEVMHEKLAQSQKILEAVVTSDWVGLETHARELEQLTNDRRWAVLKYPEYARHADAFIQSIKDLRQVAAQRDQEKMLKSYNALTFQCVDCHRYLARERIAR